MNLAHELDNPKHSRIVVMTPKMNPKDHLAVPFGSTNSGRVYRTPDNRVIIFATPDHPIPAGPFHMVLHGWGHTPTPKEIAGNSAWRSVSKG